MSTRPAEQLDILGPPVVPHDQLAEESVLGSVLLSPLCMAQLGQLRAEDFYVPQHRVIWRAMVDLWERNVAIDYPTLSNRLASADMADAGVGFQELSEIGLRTPSAAHAEHYAKIVTDTATQRRYADAAQQIAEAAWRSGADIEELTGRIDVLIEIGKISPSHLLAEE